jgi:phytoene dehydrogenase-like protein
MKIYLDYYYPLGGTGALPRKLVSYILKHGGEIITNTRINHIDPIGRYVTDADGHKYEYDRLIWAADLNSLYNYIELNTIKDESIRDAIISRKQELIGKLGNDSIFTLYLAVDLDPSYFSEKSTEHFFYTPSRLGESSGGSIPYDADEAVIKEWLIRFAALTTYEISIPVLRDSKLAPPGKTGLIISVLFDYRLTKQIRDDGWYDEFVDFLGNQIINTLDKSIYRGLKNSIIHRFSSSPLSIEERTGNTHGAITGWAFTNNPMPAENRLPKIFNSIKTPIPGVLQAGQWTYSPSGLPISILTGKLAADRVIKELK